KAVERKVLEPHRLDGGLSFGNRSRSEVDADKLALRQAISHGDQVTAIVAAQLEHAATLHRGWLHTKQCGQRLQSVRMRLRIEGAGIGYVVVQSLHRLRHGIPRQSALETRIAQV